MYAAYLTVLYHFVLCVDSLTCIVPLFGVVATYARALTGCF